VARRNRCLDLENIADELEGMARSGRREIRNCLTVLLIRRQHRKKAPASD
jgi:Domain of unknown function DUF29